MSDKPEPNVCHSIHGTLVRFFLNGNGYIVKHDREDGTNPVFMSANHFALGWNAALRFGSPADGISPTSRVSRLERVVNAARTLMRTEDEVREMLSRPIEEWTDGTRCVDAEDELRAALAEYDLPTQPPDEGGGKEL